MNRNLVRVVRESNLIYNRQNYGTYYVRTSPWLDKLWGRSVGALMRFAYQHLFSGDEFRYRGYFDLAAFCVLFRSDRISRANSNAICRFFDVKWMKFSVVLDMRTT